MSENINTALSPEKKDRAVKPAAKRVPPRLLSVINTQKIGGKMMRVTMSGDELRGFPEDKNGSHIKVFLPRPGQVQPVLPTLGEKGPIWPPADQRPITRTYSVRRYCKNNNELDVDFVLHGHDSPASGWAAKACIGDKIGIAGPGGPDPLLAEAEQHIIAGDLSALPAISALLENLPKTAKGMAFIYIEDASHQVFLVNNSGVEVHWVVHPYLRGLDALFTAVKDFVRHDSKLTQAKSISAFVAGENSSVIKLRDFLIAQYGLTKRELYAVPYWRRGQDEEGYHQQRHTIMDEEY